MKTTYILYLNEQCFHIIQAIQLYVASFFEFKTI